MNELNAILDAWRSLEGRERDAVLATVVHVSGSAYRRPGARMLIVPGGRRIGCVSGGCLEGEIARKAWWFTESGAPVVRVYDTTSGDDAVWEFGLGCNGVVHVMLERVNTAEASAMLSFLDRQRAAQKAAVAAVVVRADDASGIEVGDRLLLDESCARRGNLSRFPIEGQVLAHAAAALSEKASRLVHLGAIDVFVEWIGPPLSLVVFGAGHDAIPLVNIANQLGWDVTVADGRPAYARPERFPAAGRVIRLQARDLLGDVFIGPETAVVMMTHNYPLDARLLPRILPLRPRYLGMLGPKARAERLLSELGLTPPAWLHAPAGLDVGCDTPEAIALSMVSEIQAEINSRSGGKLRRRRDPIHSAAYEVGMSGLEKAMASPPSFCETAAGIDA